MKNRLEEYFEYNPKLNLINEALHYDAKKINQFHSSNIDYFKKKVNFNVNKTSILWHFRNFRA